MLAARTASRRFRHGFTLIELLVVIAIIGVLIGLLLPAVQKVRAAAARSSCTNNLKQIALAMHMYQDTYANLPTGWVTTNTLMPAPGWNWSLLILPFIEQGNLYNTINPDLTTTLAPVPSTAPTFAVQLAALQTPIKTLVCPADISQPLNTAFGNVPSTYSKMNYVVNREVTGPDVNNKPAPLSVQSIRDGSSNTILLGERDMAVGVAAVMCVRASNTTASFEGRPGGAPEAAGLPAYSINPNPQVDHNRATFKTGDDERLAFMSQHAGGANFAFADGSVHFISQNIDADPSGTWVAFPAANGNFSFQNLIHPNDGRTIVFQIQ